MEMNNTLGYLLDLSQYIMAIIQCAKRSLAPLWCVQAGVDNLNFFNLVLDEIIDLLRGVVWRLFARISAHHGLLNPWLIFLFIIVR